MTANDARVVANHFIRLSKETNDLLTPMQILKLVYLAHGWMLGLYGRPLISQNVMAWKYGPVIVDVYHSLKSFRATDVDREIVSPVNGTLGELEADLVTKIYNAYKDWNGIELSNLTHRPDSPWSVTVDKSGLDSVISNDLIQDYFKKLANQ
jgi:uncharacterized phage-associated protein